MYPDSINELIRCFKQFPGIGDKSAERLVFSLLDFDNNQIDNFCDALNNIKKIKRCIICNNYSDTDVCSICSDSSRTNDMLFVVEKAKDIGLFEKMNGYNGKYHILGGVISPINGINPEDLNLNSLVERVQKYNIKEVIVVLKPSIEGETTTQYIKKILSKYDVKVSKIPIGIPIGAEIEYIDSLTLELAFEERKKIS